MINSLETSVSLEEFKTYHRYDDSEILKHLETLKKKQLLESYERYQITQYLKEVLLKNKEFLSLALAPKYIFRYNDLPKLLLSTLNYLEDFIFHKESSEKYEWKVIVKETEDSLEILLENPDKNWQDTVKFSKEEIGKATLKIRGF